MNWRRLTLAVYYGSWKREFLFKIHTVTVVLRPYTSYNAVPLMLTLFDTRVRGTVRHELRFLNLIVASAVLPKVIWYVSPFDHFTNIRFITDATFPNDQQLNIHFT